ncbi:MAG: DUF4838 domain-containing protein [Bacteroidaceae bacterium]|nr:DUF4838 domain-containing protein [Bacteroidaceae bacterium]
MNHVTYIITAALLLVHLSCQGNLQADKIDSPFEYREIYLPERGSDMTRKLHLNNLDTDWGLWGHKLSSVLPEHHSQTVYASSGSELLREQFCFTSPMLFDYIVKYIDDYYGEDDTNRFAILPNDNSIVCQCADCRECGNTESDASPAVYQLINKLAQRFPNHMFYASYYRTTRKLPQQHLPQNAGVLISTMGFPLSPVETQQETNFIQLLHNFHEKCNHIYIWDYINNFDDYLTPFPLFSIMQHRLQIYARGGVDGVFLNGSGTDYSSFSPLRTHILALMLQNPDIDWRKELIALCHKHYPKTGNIIANYLIAQDDYTTQCGQILPIYDGTTRALKTYLPADRFVEFYDSLVAMHNNTLAWEREQTSKLISALAFTRLELMRLDGDTTGALTLLKRLALLPDEEDIDVYTESCWTIGNYIRDYKFMLHHADVIRESNLLRGKDITPLTPLDEDYSDTSVLTDGLLGLPSNYHCGQMISSATPALRLSIPVVEGMQRLRLCFTRNPLYQIELPQSVTLRAGGHDIATITPQPHASESGHSFVEFQLPTIAKGNVEAVIIRNTEFRTMALEEIEGLKN